jgi:hypothetical protein
MLVFKRKTRILVPKFGKRVFLFLKKNLCIGTKPYYESFLREAAQVEGHDEDLSRQKVTF